MPSGNAGKIAEFDCGGISARGVRIWGLSNSNEGTGYFKARKVGIFSGSGVVSNQAPTYDSNPASPITVVKT